MCVVPKTWTSHHVLKYHPQMFLGSLRASPFGANPDALYKELAEETPDLGRKLCNLTGGQYMEGQGNSISRLLIGIMSYRGF